LENIKAKETNVNLYTRYKMLSWDYLFYYAIIFLFFTETKGINAADVLLAEALYPVFKMIFLVPATVMIEALGKRNSLIIGNLFVCFAILTYIAGNNIITVIIGELLSAIGFIIKGVCESNILYDSLEKNEKRGSKFAKIEGKGISYYYWIEAITSVISGFLFVINGYIPMFLCLLSVIVSTGMAVKFRNIDEENNSTKISKKMVKKECRNLFRSFKLFSRSPRLKNLIFFGALISAVFLSITMLRSSVMKDIGVPEKYFGVIFAILEIISGIAAKNENKFHNKYRNRTLTVISIPLIISLLLIGTLCNLNLSYQFSLAIIIISLLIQYIVKGPFYPLIKRYLNNFTTTNIRNKISSSFNLLENFFRFIITFIASMLLRITDTANTFLILGIGLGIIICYMLYNMRDKVGLKPEEYSEKDTKIMDIK
jgi:hypothetical protein